MDVPNQGHLPLRTESNNLNCTNRSAFQGIQEACFLEIFLYFVCESLKTHFLLFSFDIVAEIEA